MNAAEGNRCDKVNTSSQYYSDLNLNYLGFNIDDDQETDITVYFYDAAKFIHENINDTNKTGLRIFQIIFKITF